MSSFEQRHDLVSAMSEKTAIPFSAFKTPYLNTSRWNHIDQLGDVFGLKYFASQDANGFESFVERGVGDTYENDYDPYPAWSEDADIPVSRERIQSIFVHLQRIFGFQYDNTKNMYDYLMRMLDSRASRMGSAKALRSLHADYIGGINSNYRKWYFGSQMDIEDKVIAEMQMEDLADHKLFRKRFKMNVKNYSLPESEMRWASTTNSFLPDDCIIQLAIYLLIWGESNNIRFMPECLCFIFKACVDCFYSLEILPDQPVQQVSHSFLDHVITPLYNFYRDELYEQVDGYWVVKDKDHSKIIGYDDINQTFWYRNGLLKLKLFDNTKLMERQPFERYLFLNQINWPKSVKKTYYEYRSWFHVLINFNRIWNIHVGVFWYYTCLNASTLYTPYYTINNNNQPTVIAQFSALSIAGSLVAGINLLSLLFECAFVPRSWYGAIPLLSRAILTFVIFLLNTLPCFYIFLWTGVHDSSSLTLAIAITQFLFSIFTVAYFSITPLAYICGNPYKSDERRFLPSFYFTNFIYELKGRKALASIGLWGGVFVSKFTESYFFLTLSLRDPVRELSIIRIRHCAGEEWIGKVLCEQESNILLGLMLVTDLTLFFLDTYLWYIIWNTMFSVARSFYCGVSIWTPWRNMFVRLPQRILSKVLNHSVVSKCTETQKKEMLYKIWNSIIISMYRDHLISIEHLESLIYEKVTDKMGNKTITDPYFFLAQEDGENSTSGNTQMDSESEASRRLSFFAHSLSTSIAKIMPLDEMPTFSVLIPHYSEKITLSLQEVIRREDEFSNITMLEYLKHLYPDEWHNFVRDTKLLAAENITLDEKKELSDVPYYAVGFKAATPEYILRTRIWASLRAQTLFRTISGFMNYSRAIKLLYSTECEDPNIEYSTNLEKANIMAQRKFRLVVSLQRMKEFTPEQEEAKEFLLRTYPELQIAYLDVEIDPVTKDYTYYSALIDGNCDIMENGQRKPKYRIRLSGKPILGDGKADNQNHAIVFCRGEYVQLIDANQDNYLEECLKIRSVLNEFEEYFTPVDPYTSDPENTSISDEYAHPVAIVGTREYIFSENVGVLGDVAAGKEQTFGTLFARTLAQVSGKLHYGHPDFLNVIFMTTRGGVSKSQRGLHLNEDIFAGMNAMMRGGRIKHCEYFQCGKGRDLGFGSILNFTTKIGSGMSEQLLSREYFHLGTQLPLDRYLSFFYAHPGFHLNNVFILTSVKLFMLFGIHLAALSNDSVLCTYNKDVPFTDPRNPAGCYNLIPVIDWVQRCVLSIFIVFGISFIPLCVQELMERGFARCAYRIFRHFTSLSPMFEVFVCRVYSQSLVNDLAIGGARYIATGRGFSTTRTSFSQLYSRFSFESFYFAGLMFGLLLYISLVMWKFSLLYFWCTVTALLFSPFWFNPNQFSFNEFFIDYKSFLCWLTSGNARPKSDSWISHVRSTRMAITGSKIKKSNKDATFMGSNYKRPSFRSTFISQVGSKLVTTIVITTAYLFANSQNETVGTQPANSLLRLIVIAFGPIAVNAVILPVLFVVSFIAGPIVSCCSKSFPGMIANFAHLTSVMIYILFFEFMLLCQNWNFSKSVLGMFASFTIQDLVFKLVTILILSREFKQNQSNKTWWTGAWFTSGLGWYMFTQPFREYLCKVIEQSYFALDFLLSHFILLCQIPILFIPYIDILHSVLLLWLKPDNLLKKPVYSNSKRRQRRKTVAVYFMLFFVIVGSLLTLIITPIVMAKVFHVDFDQYLPEFLTILLQPVEMASKKKGLANYVKPKLHA